MSLEKNKSTSTTRDGSGWAAHPKDPAVNNEASVAEIHEGRVEHIYNPAIESPEAISRRKFLNKLTIALGGLGGAVVAVPVVGYIIAPLFEQSPDVWRTVGSITDFKVGETKQVSFADASPLPWAGVAAQTAAWVRRETETKFTAFSVNCTHLGCPVSWVAGGNLFMCPCHGGVYYADGTVAAGPPPHPLPRYDVRTVNGRLEIKASGIPLGGETK